MFEGDSSGPSATRIPRLRLLRGAGAAARGAPRCGRVSAQRVLCHGKIIDSASECFRPEFFFFAF